jgi:hypothetical protein
MSIEPRAPLNRRRHVEENDAAEGSQQTVMPAAGGHVVYMLWDSTCLQDL